MNRSTTVPTTDPRARLLAGLPVTEHLVQLAGVATSVLEGGSGPPLVPLHGPGEFAAKWRRVIPELVRSQRVIAPDLPAHRASSLPEANGRGGHVELAGSADPALLPRAPAIVGHVLGGAIAARFAVERGDRLRRLVLVDSLGLAPFRPRPAFALTMLGFLGMPTEGTFTRFMRQCSFDLDGLRAQMGALCEPYAAYNLALARGPNAKKVGRLMRELGFPAIPPSDLARIAVPTTLIWGRHDRASRLRIAEAASARYGWSLYVIEDCADDPPRDQPVAFLQARGPRCFRREQPAVAV